MDLHVTAAALVARALGSFLTHPARGRNFRTSGAAPVSIYMEMP
jgi:hypothetical protein